MEDDDAAPNAGAVAADGADLDFATVLAAGLVLALFLAFGIAAPTSASASPSMLPAEEAATSKASMPTQPSN